MQRFEVDTPPRGNARRNRGFTLVEVLISAFVLTVTILGIAASVATSGGMGDRSREEMRARRAIQSWLADLQSRKFATVGYTLHGAAFDVAGLTPVGDDPDGRVGLIEFSDGPTTDTYFVDVTVRWENRGGERDIRSRVVLSNVNAEGGKPATITELKEAALARTTAPSTLQNVAAMGETLLESNPNARWAESISMALEHLAAAEALLGVTPVDLDRVAEQLASTVVELENAITEQLDPEIGARMVEEVTGVMTALGAS